MPTTSRTTPTARSTGSRCCEVARPLVHVVGIDSTGSMVFVPLGDPQLGPGVGSQGPAGVAGPTGPQGPQGVAGPAGVAGPKGDKGDRGAAGATGQAGPAGPTG